MIAPNPNVFLYFFLVWGGQGGVGVLIYAHFFLGMQLGPGVQVRCASVSGILLARE